jgi:hypothetical protein
MEFPDRSFVNASCASCLLPCIHVETASSSRHVPRTPGFVIRDDTQRVSDQWLGSVQRSQVYPDFCDMTILRPGDARSGAARTLAHQRSFVARRWKTRRLRAVEIAATSPRLNRHSRSVDPSLRSIRSELAHEKPGLCATKRVEHCSDIAFAGLLRRRGRRRLAGAWRRRRHDHGPPRHREPWTCSRATGPQPGSAIGAVARL